MSEEVSNPDLRSQDERQFELIRDLNSRVPSNPQGDAAEAGLKKILQSLNKNSLSDALRDSFSAEKLKEWKEYADKEFEAMGQINRKRVRNLAILSDEDMHRTMFEGFFLFDINPLDAPTAEVQARTGEFDDEGKPIMKTFSYEVFQKNALYGIEGVERVHSHQTRRALGTMKDSLATGITATRRVEIDEARTIDFLGEALRIYSTPSLLLDIEQHCRDLILQHLDQAEDTVGVRVELDHMGATLLGMAVDMSATVIEVQGRRITLQVEASDSLETVAKATHVRFVIDVAKQAQRIEEKAAKAAKIAEG